MSTSIDSRVVELLFDNSNFERNAQQSINTLNTLDRQIENTGLSSGLDTFEKTANGINLSALSNSLGGLGDIIKKVFAIETVTRWLTTLEKKTEALVKSMSIDPIKQGWGKFEEKTTSVMTIMSATGKTVDEVNKSLEKLNWFTDETSYSYSDMVSNIGKFTAAGVDLDVAISAMEGIANVAAVSGQNTQAASRAMYNFSQALGQGAVKLMDWKSIENANMATVEFKQTIIDTAVALGNVKKVSDGVYQSISEHGQLGEEFGVESFSKSLSEGWFTKEVLVQTLAKYSDYADAVYEISDAYNTCSEAMRHVDASSMKLGEKAFKAAQEAKTFTDAIEATKDAVSTGWLNAFELLFGNYEEAKELWTDLCSDLWEIFASGFNKADGTGLNDILYDFTHVGVGEFQDYMTDAGLSVSQFEEAAKKAITNAGGNLDDLIYEYGSLKHVMETGAFSADDLTNALAEMANSAYATTYGIDTNNIAFDLFVKKVQSVQKYSHSTAQTYNELKAAGIDVAENQELIDKVLNGQIKNWDQVKKSGTDWIKVLGEDGNKALANYLTNDEFLIKSNKDLDKSFKTLIKSVKETSKEVGLGDEFYDRMAKAGYDLSDSKEVVQRIVAGEIKTFDDLTTAEKEAIFFDSEYVNSLKDLYSESKLTNGELSELIDNMVTPSGRTLIIDTFFDGLHSLMEIGSAVGRAITDIFPIPTAEQFYSIIEKIQNGMSKFKGFIDSITPDPEDEEKVGNLTRILRGLVAVLDIIVVAISPLKNIFTGILDVVSKRLGFVLKDFGYFGDKIVDLRDKIKELTIFNTIGDRIYKVVSILTNAIFDLYSVITIYGNSLLSGNGVLSTIIGLINRIAKDGVNLIFNLISAITGLDMSTISSKVTKVMQNIADAITAIASRIEIIAKGKFTSFVKQLKGNFDEAAESAVGFKEKINSIFSGIQDSELGQKILGIGSGILTAIRNVFNTIITTLDDVISNMHIGSEEIKGFFDTLTVGTVSVAIAKLASSIGGIGGVITFLSEKFQNMGTTITGVGDFVDKFKAILDGITSAMKSYEGKLKAEAIKEIAISIAILAGALFVLSKIDYKQIAAGLIGLQASAGDVIAIMYALENMNFGQVATLITVAKAIQKLAISIVILAVAMKIISTIDPFQMAMATAAIAALLYELTFIMKEITSMDGKAAKGASSLIALSAGVLILSFAVKNLSGLSWEEIAKGLSACVILIFVLAETMKIMNNSQVKGAAASVLGIAIAIRILAGAVITLGALPLDQLAKGVLSCIYLILALSISVKIMGKPAGMIGAAIGIMALAKGIQMLVGPIMLLGNLKLEQLAKGIGSIVVILAALALSTRVMNPVSMTALGIAMVPFSFGIGLLADAMSKIGDLPIGNIIKAEAAIIVLIGALALASRIANPITLVALGISVTIFAAGVLILAEALTAISAIPIGGLIKAGIAIVALVGSLVLISVAASAALPLVLALSASILIFGLGIMTVSVGIMALSVGITMLSVSIATAGAGILGTLGIILVGLVDMVVTVVVNFINSLHLIFDALVAMLPSFYDFLKVLISGISSTIIEILPSVLSVIKTFLLGVMDLLNSLMPKAKTFIINFIHFVVDIFISAVPSIKKALKTWIVALLEVIEGIMPNLFKIVKAALSNLMLTIKELLPEFLDLVSVVITDILALLSEKIPEFVEFILNLIESLLETITEKMPDLMEKGKELIITFLDGMIDAIPDIAEKAMELINTFMMTISESAVDLADSGFEMITNFINGLTETINERGPELTEALEGLFDAVFNNGLNFIDTFSESFKEKGIAIIERIKDGIEEKKELVKEKLDEIINSLPSSITQSFKDFVENGRTIITKIRDGMISVKNALKNKLIEFKDNALKAITDTISDWVEVGKNLIDGLIEGITNAPEAVKDAAINVVNGAVEGVKDLLGIASPSKLFKAFGKYVDEGFAIGIDNNSNLVEDSTENLGKSAANGMKNAISKLADAISNDMDFNPVISPVLDMSNIEDGASRINSMLTGSQAYSVNAAVNRKLESNAKILELQNRGNNMTVPNNVTFNQYNTSPKALSRIEIYRQTNNQISQLRGGYA